MTPAPRLLLCLAVALACGACAHAPARPGRSALAGVHWEPSPNHNARHAVIVVIHATEQGSVAESLETLRTANSGGPVSAHYLVGRDGAIYQLVDEDLRAWHAGGGHWGTITDLNSASIGIELDNDGQAPFPDLQIQALLGLLADICARNDIPRTQVIGHADLAPERKRDPGARFPWAQLAGQGFGLWPRGDAGDPPPAFDAWVALRLLGYPMGDPAAALKAFRLHFRGIEDDSPEPDAVDRRLLFALEGDAWTPSPGQSVSR
jgi:N-acetyl-anhydromuramyl-L-alanine amidase AmpD